MDQQDPPIPEWFRAMAHDQKQRIVTDKFIGRIAKHIGADWELIAAEMDISRPKREAIVAKHPRSIQLQVAGAFTTWKQKNSRQATIASLIQILWQCNDRCTIDWDDIEEVVMGDW
ncbi:FAS-associated death domain protein-like [Haliotis cracherodii]|uniref:FAS-associated death domain protein-like n=1 Tax=Haliotis cracherodii TaxID=6455 RepID=UPI0039ED2331